MKLTSTAFTNFGKSLPKFILVFGPDELEISVTLKKLQRMITAHHKEEVETSYLTFKDIKDDPAILRDELATGSLFVSNKIVVVKDTSPSLPKALGEFITSCNSPHHIIFLADNLPKASSTLALFEKNPAMLAIVCYKPDAAHLVGIIKEDFVANGYIYPSEIIPMMLQALPPNKMIISNELEKLATYLGERKKITTEDINGIISYSQELSLDGLCEAIVSRNPVLIQRQMVNLEKSEHNFMLVIRVLANFFMRVLRVKLMVNSGKSMEQAVMMLKPPAFFKGRDNITLAVRTMKQAEIQDYLLQMLEIEIACKKGLGNPDAILEQFLCMKYLR